jgi:hypothetical protein
MFNFSKVILKEKYGGNLLDFENNIVKRIFAFTLNLEGRDPYDDIDDFQKDDRYYKIFNQMKTVSCRASIIIENPNHSDMSSCVMFEIRNSTFRQIFDEYL